MKVTETLKWPVPMTFAAGCVNTIGTELKGRGCKKVLIFHGKSVEKTGLPTKLKELIEKEGIGVIDCNESESDPTEQMIDRVGNAARDAGVDGVVAVGGGSALDAAKGIKVLINNPGQIKEYYLGTNKPQVTKAPLIVVPTTSGTGSEVDRAAMISDAVDGRKRVLIGIGATPDLALVDPELTVTCPPNTTAGCGFDALAHSIDAVTGKLSNEAVSLLAYTAIKLIRDNLGVALEDGTNLEARTGLHMASMLGGVNIANANCSAAHAFAHGMGATFHISHGNCCAIFTPACIEFVAEECPDAIRKIGELIGVEFDGGESNQQAARKVSEAIYHWYRACGLSNIAELIPNKEDAAAKIIPMAKADVNGLFCRRALDDEGAAWVIDRTYEMAEQLG